jgi:hypothetical protein
VVVVVLMVDVPLTVPDLIGSPPLVVGLAEASGVVLGLALDTGVAEATGLAETLGEGVGVRFFMNLVVALNVRKPKVPRTTMVMRPAMNDFICHILYTKESRLFKLVAFPSRKPRINFW